MADIDHVTEKMTYAFYHMIVFTEFFSLNAYTLCRANCKPVIAAHLEAPNQSYECLHICKQTPFNIDNVHYTVQTYRAHVIKQLCNFTCIPSK